MKVSLKSVFITAAASVLFISCTQEKKPDYPIRPVPFTSVRLTDNFWAPRILKNEQVTIPIAFGYCESTGRIKNFEIAGGLDTGTFRTIYPFDDSDVFKIIEGAAFSLQSFSDEKLSAYLDTLIWKIGLAQEDDGYLYTNRTIAEMHGGKGLHEWASPRRWELDSVLSHELYNLGHLYEAAVAHYQATGKRSLLDIALKSADLVDSDFGHDRLKVYPGHQVIEMGLVKLYRVTGESRYLDLARFFLDIRENGQEYNQAHTLPVNQTEAAGHAVRATYMYSGMADVAALTGDKKYLNAITKIWEDIVFSKMYVTGGIGSTGGNEGFAGKYFLPNLTAYCETCASIGDIFFNHRLFMLHGEAKYYDILEKALYNSMLSGVSLSADRFFYPNPLESDGRHKRQAWFGCACCPSNVARFLPALPGYIYAASENNLYVNLFISSEAETKLGTQTIRITQTSGLPWDGKVKLEIFPEKTNSFAIKIRIPGWAGNEAIPGDLYKFADNQQQKTIILVNGDEYSARVEKGYAVVRRKWEKGDEIVLSFPFNVRRLNADPRIKDDAGKTAFQRGPVIYCAEWPDNNTGNVRNLVVDTTVTPEVEYRSDLLDGTTLIKVEGYQLKTGEDGSIRQGDAEKITLIPYALWNNRGPGEMRVWLAKQNDAAIPLVTPDKTR